MTSQTAKKIINATNALECKELSHEILNFEKTAWEEIAKSKCKPGIFQKFCQNSCLLDVLIHCTGTKQIIESAKDKFWGTGIPLQEDDCLNPRRWLSRGSGIMGEILTEIRDELRNTPIHTPTPPNTSTEDQQHPPNTQHPVLTLDQATGGADTENVISAGNHHVMEH